MKKVSKSLRYALCFALALCTSLSVCFAFGVKKADAAELVDAKTTLITYTSSGTQNGADRFTMTADGANFNISGAGNQSDYTIAFNGSFTGDFETEYDVKGAAWGLQALTVLDLNGVAVARLGWFSNGAYGKATTTAYTDCFAWVEDVAESRFYTRVDGVANTEIQKADGNRTAVQGDRGVYLSYGQTGRTGCKIELAWENNSLVFKIRYAEATGETSMKEVGRIAAEGLKNGYKVTIGGVNGMNLPTAHSTTNGCPITIYSVDGVSLKAADLNEGQIDISKEVDAAIKYEGEVYSGGKAVISISKGDELEKFYLSKSYGFELKTGSEVKGKWIVKTELDEESAFAYNGTFADKAVGSYDITVKNGESSKDYVVKVIVAVKATDLIHNTIIANATEKDYDKIYMTDGGLYYDIFNGNASEYKMDVAGVFNGNLSFKFKSPTYSWGAMVFVIKDTDGNEVFTVGMYNTPYQKQTGVAYLYDTANEKYYSRQNGAVVEVSEPLTIAYGKDTDGNKLETDYERNALPVVGDGSTEGELNITFNGDNAEIKWAYNNGTTSELRSLGTIAAGALKKGYTITFAGGKTGHAPLADNKIVYGCDLLITQINDINFTNTSENRLGEYILAKEVTLAHTITYAGEKFVDGKYVIDLPYGEELAEFTAQGVVKMSDSWTYVDMPEPQSFRYAGTGLEQANGAINNGQFGDKASGIYDIIVYYKGLKKEYTVKYLDDIPPAITFKSGIKDYVVSDDIANAFSVEDVIATDNGQTLDASNIVISIKAPNSEEFVTYDEYYSFDLAKFGEYVVKYTAVDAAKNSAELTRKIYYAKMPSITVNGKIKTSVLLGEKVTLPDAEATDADGDEISYTISVVYESDGSEVTLNDMTFVADKEGNYRVVYICGSGKETASEEFVVNAKKDTESPVISGEVSKTEYKVGETVTLPVLTVTDNSGSATLSVKIFKGTELVYEGTLTAEYTFVANEECVYTVKYLATDENGNESSKTVTVSVIGEETQNPVNSGEENNNGGCNGCGSSVGSVGLAGLVLAITAAVKSLRKKEDC